MNRMRLLVLSGFMVLGGLGLGASSAKAQYAGGPTAAPRSYAAPGGYYGGGYYYAPAPSYYAPRYAAPSYYAPAYTAPAPRTTTRGGSGYTDVTGRHDKLARPWLQPLR